MDTLNLFATSDMPLYIALRMLFILVLTVVAARIFSSMTKNRWREKIHLRLMFNIIRVLIYVLGIFAMLYQFPQFDGGVETLLAGSGIAALAISLGAQESLGNFISGLVISASRPFEVGDRIHLFGGDITGNIEDITIRHTVVRTFMNSRIIVPNSVINKEMIENSNFLEEKAAGFLDAVITYDSDMDKAMTIMAEVIASHPDYIDPRSEAEKAKGETPPVVVSVRALSVYGVELRASVWTGHIDTNFSTCSDLRISLKKAFDQAGIRFAESRVSSTPPQSY